MAERERIARYFAPLAAPEPGAFALTDDAAQLIPPSGYSLMITTDSVIESIHVLPGATPEQVAQKLVRRNLSDLAAMGATPWRYLINLHTPSTLPEAWFAAFAHTLAAEQSAFHMTLIGGDSTSGGEHVHATMTCIGLLDGIALRRTGAQRDDDLYISGSVGDAALGLTLLQSASLRIAHSDYEFLIDRYHRPQPRLALGKALRGLATSGMDVSDGLLADAQQLAAASGVAFTLMRETVPLSDPARRLLQHDSSLWESIFTGGDDYELLFTAPPSARRTIATLSEQLAMPLTRIGMVKEGSGIALHDTNGTAIPFGKTGFEHR
ncbi:MAG: thiamine-phosphate kinase [Rhodospirillales bacterium 12-54-5]|nr:MAG: thiamine-phosphate kinase [Rhodospirillales bacterium 12-54-5]